MVNFKNKLSVLTSLVTDGWRGSTRVAMAFALIAFFSAAAYAGTIKGHVYDENNDPVIGASVVQKGRPANGTATDLDGAFTLEVSGESATLEITYIGYQKTTVKATAGKEVTVNLTTDATKLDEVVVVAYGAQKKVAVTGAVASVDTKDIKKSSAARVDNALQGRVTGLVSFQNGGGMPGSDAATMYLRGVSSNRNQSPLILVDGVERSSIGEIDPNEIESLSVLKDASATAVFGVRGANGVILITTRRGHDGKPDLGVSFEQSWTSFTRRDKRLHGVEWMRLTNQATLNDGGTDVPYSEKAINHFEHPYGDPNNPDPTFDLDPNAEGYELQKSFRDFMYPDHYWVKELMKTTTPQSKVNINMAGGSQTFRYFINAGYIHQGGNFKNESKDKLGYDPAVKSDQWKFRSNLDFDINKYFHAFLNVATYVRQNNQPNAQGLYGGDLNYAVRDIFYLLTTEPPIYAGPLTIAGKDHEAGLVIQPYNMDRNPYKIINRYGYYHRTNVQMQSTLGLSYDLSKLITPGLKISGNISYDSWSYNNRGSNNNEPDINVNAYYETGEFGYADNGDLSRSYSLYSNSYSNYKINAQAQLNYNRTFGKHDVGAMILAQRDYSEPIDGGGTGDGYIPHNVIGTAFRATYGFDSRYLFEFDLGYNGSEQFAPGNRFGTFPAFSLGWVISNEKFMQPLKDKWLDNLKIRFSQGRVGSDGVPNRFLYMDDNSISSSSNVGGLGYGVVRTINQNLIGNKTLKWETADKTNIGLDLGLFKQFTFTIEGYREKRKDILIRRQTIPDFQGISSGVMPYVNMGRINNKGLEIELGWQKRLTNDFSLNVKANWGTNRNEVKFWDEVERDETYYYRKRTEGFALGQCWGYKIDYSSNGGFFTSQEDIDHYGQTQVFNEDGTPALDAEGNTVWEGQVIKYGSGKPRPGDFKYVDFNGDGTIDEKDQIPLKHTGYPGITYGASLELNYKGIDFSVFFSGLGRFSKVYGSQNVYESIGNGYFYEYQRKAWTAERWANGEEITYPALTRTSSVSQRANDFFTMKRSFTRLKNIILGYTLPVKWTSKIGVKSCRIYVSGENLFVWDHLKANHIDPEQNDAIGYPITKNMTVGINVNF